MKESLATFRKAVNESADLQEKLKGGTDLVELGKENGYDFSQEDVTAAFEELFSRALWWLFDFFWWLFDFFWWLGGLLVDFFVLSRSLGVAFWWLGGLLVAAAVAVAVRKFFLSKKK